MDSLHLELQKETNDTLRMTICYRLGILYDDANLDSSVFYNEKGLLIAKKLGLKINEANMLTHMAFPLAKLGNYTYSHRVLTESLRITGDPSSERIIWKWTDHQTPRDFRISVSGYTYLGFGSLYNLTGNHDKRITAYYKGIDLAESIKDTILLALLFGDLGDGYRTINKPDSAMYYWQRSLKCFSVLKSKNKRWEGGVHSSIGAYYEQAGKYELAKVEYEKAMQVSEVQNNLAEAGVAYIHLARLFQIFQKPDSSLLFYKKAIDAYKSLGDERKNVFANRMISEYYLQNKNPDSAFAYLRIATSLNDSLEAKEKKRIQEYQVMGFNEQLQMQEQEKKRVEVQSRIRTYSMLIGIAFLLLIAFLLYVNNRNRRKANDVLTQQKAELQSTLSELRSTQAQLIQAEKMASLGELTSGIAHEIQNPLNFVNNFSEVSGELIEEAKALLASHGGQAEENSPEVTELLDDIEMNLGKINHHGKRADAIVKSMLQHSRTGSGEKMPTDLNDLAEEYLNLAYHSFRRKDLQESSKHSFNVQLKTNFASDIGKVDIVPQEIGRVLLNIYNNAFYAVSAKAVELAGNSSGSPATADSMSEKSIMNGAGYEPELEVNTRRKNGFVEITVRDNGPGIPEKIRDKIFQPFFTTKPTGQGTGLGLSLSYDIIKSNGGNIRVKSVEGEGSEFIVELNV